MNKNETFCNPDEADCPYTAFKKTCKSHRDKCGKWVMLCAGKNAQTGEPIYQWACEDSWRPILAIEQVAAVEALDKNLELLRNDMAKRDNLMMQVSLDQSKALNTMGLLLQRIIDEITRQNDSLIKIGQERILEGVKVI